VPVLFFAVPTSLEAVKVLQKSGRECPEDEGDTGSDQRHAEEGRPYGRPAYAAAADGSAQADQGCIAHRRMSADAASVPSTDLVLYSDHDRSRCTSGVVHVAA